MLETNRLSDSIPAPTIRTKLTPPSTLNSIVRREKLVARLNDVRNRPPHIYLISAPAGCGKTTLVSEWLEGTRHRFAWLTLDVGDNDPNRFTQYLIMALSQLDEHIGETAFELLKAPSRSSHSFILDSLLVDISTLNEQIVLILDDYHLIQSKSVHDFIGSFIELQPETLDVAIVTREDPPFSLSRLRTQNRVTDIRARDLQLSYDETKLFFLNETGLQFESHVLRMLHDTTEGWLAGIKLAAHSLAGQDHDEAIEVLRDFSGGSRYVMEYFGEEVFRDREDDVTGFLTSTGILSKFNIELANAVTGRTDSARFVSRLVDEGLFISLVDNEDGWYRYHPLFASFLHARADDATRSEECLVASRWFLEREMYIEAVKYALLGKNFDLAVEIIVMCSARFLDLGRSDTILEWISSLPEPLQKSSNAISICKGWALYVAGRFNEAESAIFRLSVEDAECADSGLRLRYFILRFWLREVAGETRDVDRLQETMWTEIADEPFFRLHQLVLLGKTLFFAGKIMDALQYFDEALSIANERGNRFFYACSAHLLAYCHIGLGNLTVAETLCRRVLKEDDDTTQPFAFMMYPPLAYSRYLLDDTDTADEYVRLAFTSDVSRSHAAYMFDDGAWISTMVRVAMGNSVNTAENAMQEDRVSGSDVQVEILVDIALRNQDFESVIQIARPFVERRRETPELGIVFSGFIRALIATGRSGDSLGMMLPMLEDAKRNALIVRLVILNILSSLAALAVSDIDRAAAYMLGAVDYAAPSNIQQPFFNGDLRMIEAINLLRPQAHTFAWQLIQALSGDVSDADSKERPMPAADILSRREIDVMELIATGMTNSEIGEKLFIGAGTVKWHVNNILGKLDVKNRTTAIKRARDLNLIS